MLNCSNSTVLIRGPSSLSNQQLYVNQQTYFFHFSALAHPRHYAENGLRLLEEGDGVEGSSGFPGSVRLHPLHGPPACTASSLVLPSSPLLLQRHRVCGAPATDGQTTNLLLLRLRLSLLLLLLLRGMMLVSPWRTTSRVVVVFNLTSNSLLWAFDIRSGRTVCQCCDDALSLSEAAGGDHANAPPLSRLWRSAPHLTADSKTHSESARVRFG